MINKPITECVYYEKSVDTHSIASVTIPIDGVYYLEIADLRAAKWFKNGSVLYGVKKLAIEGCPHISYEAKEMIKRAKAARE